MSAPKQDPIPRFWAKVNKDGPNGCWEWTASQTPKGYGSFSPNQKSVRAHRWIWEQVNGEIPEGMCICHHCDNRLCVNPSHLFCGTHRDNLNDHIRKHGHWTGRLPDRKAVGARNGNAKLTPANVRAIRDLLRRRELSHSRIGALFGVTKHTIRNIETGRLWGHLEG